MAGAARLGCVVTRFLFAVWIASLGDFRRGLLIAICELRHLALFLGRIGLFAALIFLGSPTTVGTATRPAPAPS